MNTAKFSVTILMVGLFLLCTAHEEPAKTLYERKQKQETISKYAENGIQSITLWKFTVDHSDGEKLMTMKYDKDGTYLSVEAFEKDSLTLRVMYDYNKHGDMISDSDYNPDGLLKEKNVFSYDKKGRVISGSSYEGAELLTSRFNYKHSKDKRTIEFLKYNADGKLDYTLLYTYNGDFDKQDYESVVKYDAEGTVQMKVEKKYNTSGNVTHKLIYDKEGVLNYSFEYLYDGNGNNNQINRYDKDNKILKKDIFTYDQAGFCTEQVSIDSGNNIQFRLVYEYQHFRD